jgi:hypothetical protein
VFISWHLLPQYSDVDTGTIAALIQIKHNTAKAMPARNVNPRFLTTPNIHPIILLANPAMAII